MVTTQPPPPPPDTWAVEQYQNVEHRYTGNGEVARGGIADSYDAWKHCKDVSRDDSRTPDLYDLLSHSVRETQYSFPPEGVRGNAVISGWCLSLSWDGPVVVPTGSASAAAAGGGGGGATEEAIVTCAGE